MSPRGGRIHHQRLVLLAALCLALGACTSPVRAVRVDRTVAHRDLTRSAVTTGEPSWPTRDVLVERGLLDVFGERPEVALAALHRAMIDLFQLRVLDRSSRSRIPTLYERRDVERPEPLTSRASIEETHA